MMPLHAVCMMDHISLLLTFPTPDRPGVPGSCRMTRKVLAVSLYVVNLALPMFAQQIRSTT